MTRTDTGRRPRFRPSLDLLEARENPASPFVASGTIAGGAPLVDVAAPGGATLARFAPFESTFTGGVRAAAGELDGNPNTVEVAAVPGPGGGSRVAVFAVDTSTGAVTKLADFFAFEPAFRDGLRVAVGRVDPAAATDQVVIGADAGGGPRVSTFNLAGGQPVQLAGPLGNFFAFEDTLRGGVRVGVGNISGQIGGADQLVVGAGVGGAPRVRAFGLDGVATQDFFAPGISGTNGVNVGFLPLRNGAGGQFFTDALADDVSQRNAALNAPILAQLGATGSSGTVFGGTGTTGVTFNNGTGVSAFGIGGGVFNTGITNGAGLVFSNPATTGLFGGNTGFTNGVFGSGLTTGTGIGGGLFNTGGLGTGLFGTGAGVPSFTSLGTTGTTGSTFSF